MPGIARMIISEENTVYHVISRTALDGFPFGDVEKDELIKIILKLSKLYFTEVFGFCIMGNHFHLLVRMWQESDFTDEEIKNRYVRFYGEDREFSQEMIPGFRLKWASLSEFVKEIKQTFSRYYNKRHNRRGTLWGERFKSLIVEDGETLVNCLAYIDLNPIRADIVGRPEDYRWNTLGYHTQTGNKDNFLSFDFGLKEFGVMDEKERLRRYRRYVYEAGALKRSDGKPCITIDENVLEKERKTDFQTTKLYRFRYRTRYFSDSGIIGTKEFVSRNYDRFKDLFQSKHEKKPKPIKGLDGIYSLKRLANDTPEIYSEIPKDFSFEVKSNAWCGVAINPSTAHDIRVDDDLDFGSPYESSTDGGTQRDFVVTNGHVWGDAVHYAQVYGGSPSNYTIEAEWEAYDLSFDNPYSDTMEVDDVLQMYEVSLAQGQNYHVSLSVLSGNGDTSIQVFKPSRNSGSRVSLKNFERKTPRLLNGF